MGKYSKYNRGEVLSQVEALITESEEYMKNCPSLGYKRFYIRQVCDKLSIFDWWNDLLSYCQLKEMRSFLVWAGKLGYDGYVCFKVGASGCANGMWAYKAETTTGYSPDGECLYRSFTPDYVTYDVLLPDNTWLSRDKVNWSDIRRKDVEKAIAG